LFVATNKIQGSRNTMIIDNDMMSAIVFMSIFVRLRYDAQSLRRTQEK
jgi:hypothetical protein